MHILTEILHNQVKPALGCTEPGAVALAVARAKEELGEEVYSLSVAVDKNVLKNCMDVGIPGTEEHGIVFAAALSLVCGKSAYGLEALKEVSDEDITKANLLVMKKVITLSLDEEAQGLSITVTAKGERHTATVIIRKSHTNIVYVERDGEVLLDSNGEVAANAPTTDEIKFKLLDYTIADLYHYANTVPLEEIQFLQEGVDMNLRIGEIGISQNVGVGFGRMLAGDMLIPQKRAKAFTSAASEARMAGWPLPVMSSAGSGNHGLVAIIPIAVIGRDKRYEPETILRAIAFSHLVTAFVKVQIGVLSPVCGCGVAAGVGCAAGLVLLEGGSARQAGSAINNMIAGLSGMICDGAKIGCAYKLAISVDAACDAANMALLGADIPCGNGILGQTPEQTVRNLAKVSSDGMNNTDNVILNVMLEKC